jgi:hypothetical protein
MLMTKPQAQILDKAYNAAKAKEKHSSLFCLYTNKKKKTLITLAPACRINTLAYND